MKRFIVFLLVSLVITGSLFADTNLVWKRTVSNMIAHDTTDFVYIKNTYTNEAYYSEDYKTYITLGISTEEKVIIVVYPGVTDIKSYPTRLEISTDLHNLDDYVVILPDSSFDYTNGFVVDGDDYRLLLNEMLQNDKVQIWAYYEEDGVLLFEVNCENLNKFFY